jgi:ABC-type nitrate/sulfonate/bicarbonate transport system substrate-binding protein
MPPVPPIKEASQLRGKKLAVTRFGGTMDFAARHFLKGQGLEPGKDVVLIQIGSSADIVPAMANGLVESGVMSVPYLFAARRLGLRELADLSQSGIRYAQAALVAKKSFLKEKREVIGQFIRSLIEATHYVKTRPVDDMRVLGKYTRTAAIPRVEEPTRMTSTVKLFFLKKPASCAAHKGRKEAVGAG